MISNTTSVRSVERRPMPASAGHEECRKRLVASRATIEQDRAKLLSDERPAVGTAGERRTQSLIAQERRDLAERGRGLEDCVASFNRDAKLAGRQEVVISLTEGR